MKNLFKTLFSAILFFLFINLSFADLPCSKENNLKDKEFSNYCRNIVSSCNRFFNPVDDGANLIRIKQIPFSPVPMTAEDASLATIMTDYTAFLEELWSKTTYVWVKPLEQAKTAYLETQNAVYNCAVLWTKIKVIRNIKDTMKTNAESNIKTKLESQITSLDKEMENRKCNKPSAEQTTSYREMLLKWTTYHYCNYRFYLNYLGNFPETNLNSPTITSKVTRSAIDKEESADYARKTSRQSDAVYKEVVHSKRVYEQAFSAFSEMENTYWIHVMLLFINDDYITLRKNLSKVLAPISQLAYKIPQAQGK
ncbi:MAG: hypothetical protein ACD_3C00196G0012 [uncultured bacterium (gcode 4)]|uniref:Uncharacterized protein n=1 Tax=uncultured bacterium (gcode 4) TaxID=1234023 RepID=K2GBF7_9BACT|nr:MAG: hypothetical protein ACD_3C00196G0012 [uncultured bacterium (gcode 4)]